MQRRKSSYREAPNPMLIHFYFFLISEAKSSPMAFIFLIIKIVVLTLGSEKLYLVEPEKAFLCDPSAPQVPSWPTSRSRSTSMSEKPAEWYEMLLLPLTSYTTKVSQAFALVSGLGWLASGNKGRGGGQAEGWARSWCNWQAHPWGCEVKLKWLPGFWCGWWLDVELLRRMGIQKKEQGWKTINFMLIKVCV